MEIVERAYSNRVQAVQWAAAVAFRFKVPLLLRKIHRRTRLHEVEHSLRFLVVPAMPAELDVAEAYPVVRPMQVKRGNMKAVRVAMRRGCAVARRAAHSMGGVSCSVLSASLTCSLRFEHGVPRADSITCSRWLHVIDVISVI